jgi:hypothetical protein
MPVAASEISPATRSGMERYEVLGLLGSGGFADVHEALDRETGELVALKVLRDGQGMSARVVREIEAARALAHPNIVALRDTFVAAGRVCLVWELVEGVALDELDGLRDQDAAALGVELLDALAFAHSQGVVHRDVKPQNVMVDVARRVKVMDFGIARMLDADTLTGEGDLIGTIAYMSPEQAAGRRAGPQSDVYSAGLVLYELLAGENPLRGESPAETLSNVVAGRLPPLAELRGDLPARLTELIDAACAPRPAERPAAVEMAAALDDLLGSGALDDRVLRLAHAALRPLGRAAAAAERFGGAGLAGALAGLLLTSLPAYPASWTLPLVALAVAVWTVVPRAGLAFLLGVLAFPFFNLSAAIGVAWLAGAVALVLIAGRRPLLALWPGIAVLLAPLGLALVAPGAAAVFGRARGAATAAWTGAVLLVVLQLQREPRGPFTLYLPRSGLASDLAAADDPLQVVRRLVETVLSPQGLVQMAVFAGLAATLAVALSQPRLEWRLWLWALAFAGAFSVYCLVPVTVWDFPTRPGALALGVALAALVILLPVVLWPAAREDSSDEHPEVD